MQVSLTTTKGLQRRLEVAVPGERVAEEVDQRLRRLARTARIKGFRPGRVPYAIVRQQFGSQVHAQAVTALMQSTFAEALSEQKLRPAGDPRLEPIAVEPGEELRYAAVFEVMPEISVKPFESIRIERPAAAITEEEVDAMLETMRVQQTVFTPVQRAAREGDRVTLDFDGRIDGAAFPGGHGHGMQVSIGAHRVLPEIEQALPGMSAGESKTVEATFPADYGAPGVAGKQAQFELRATQVEEQSLPPVDEAFARAFGVQEGGVEALRAEVRRSMEREASQASHSRMRSQLLEALFRDNPIELPDALVEEQLQELQLQTMRRLGTQDPGRLPPRAEFEPAARRRVALGLIISEIVRAQGLEVDSARVQQRLDALSAGQPDPHEARQRYLASPQAMEQIESAVLEEQALERVLAQVQVTEVPMNFGELTGFGRRGESEAR